MTSNKIAFSDLEILYYGNHRGFPLNSGLTLLQNGSAPDGQDGLLTATAKNPDLKLVADYVAASFMSPKNALKVFACIEDHFLRFRLALPHTNTANSTYALVYEAGDNGGYLACENRETICEMLLELSGIRNSREMSSTGMEISPIYLLIILAACDVILQNKYNVGWFTATSVFNAYDNSGESGFSRILFSLAYVSDDIIYRSISYEDIQKAINEMAKEEILDVDEIDGTPLYAFAVEYRYLPRLFEGVKNSLAVCKHDEAGNIFILYVISNQAETWSFAIEMDSGKIKRLTAASFKELCETFLAVDGIGTSKTVQRSGKFCVNCGSSLNLESRFCANCGKLVL
ncbi:MAG: hypothetical protein ACYC4E_00030 [Carboxydocellales bacterium]